MVEAECFESEKLVSVARIILRKEWNKSWQLNPNQSFYNEKTSSKLEVSWSTADNLQQNLA